MLNGEVVLLHFAGQPVKKSALGRQDSQPLQTVVVGDYLKVLAEQVGPKILDGPDHQIGRFPAKFGGIGTALYASLWVLPSDL